MATILLIDDDDLVRDTVRAQLESGGHRVVTAHHGGEGLDMIAAAPVDLVLCDILMPEIEGLGFIRALRRRDRDVPVIAMSGGAGAGAQADYLRMAGELGATRTIRKPFAARALLMLVDDCLAGTTGRSGPGA